MTSTALILIVIAVVAAVVLVVRRRRLPVRVSEHSGNQRPAPGDRLHRQAAHYRASGALPRWDP